MWFGFQGVTLHTGYKIKVLQVELLEYLLNVFMCLSYGFGMTKIMKLIQLGSCEKIARKLLVMIYKKKHSTNSSLLFLLTLFSTFWACMDC